GRAVAPRPSAARARPAGRPPGRRRRLRRRGRGDDDRGGAPPRLSLARLGRRCVRARARDRGIELRARARRHGGPGLRPRALPHHPLPVLALLLEPVTVALPAGMRSPVGADLRAGLGAVFGGAMPSRPALALDVERPVRITRHDWRRAKVDLPGYAVSGLSTETMGRSLSEDPLFFAAALAGGSAPAELSEHGDCEGSWGGGEGEGEGG